MGILGDTEYVDVAEDFFSNPQDNSEYVDVPEDFFAEPQGGLSDTATAVYEGAKLIPKGMAAQAIAAWQGKDVDTIQGWDDNFISNYNREVEQYLAQYGKNESSKFLGISPKDVAQAMASVPYSLDSMVSGLASGALATPGGPAAQYGAGMAATGTMAYRMSANQITRDFQEALNKDRANNGQSPLSEQEWQTIKNDFDSNATEYGLWEAIPEAVGSAVGFKIITSPLKSVLMRTLGKETAEKIGGTMLGKLTAIGIQGAGALGEELTTETITQKGQGAVEADIGLRDEAPTWEESFKEVAPTTAALTGMMGLSAKAIHGGYKLVSKNDTQDLLDHNKGFSGEDLDQAPDPFANIQENTSDLPADTPMDEWELWGEWQQRAAAKEALNKENIAFKEAQALDPTLQRPVPEPAPRDRIQEAQQVNQQQIKSINLLGDETAFQGSPARVQTRGTLENAQIAGPGQQDEGRYYPFSGLSAMLGEHPPLPSQEEIILEHEVVPDNVNTEPSEAQALAGNYKKDHIKIDGLNITIENPDGSVRKGKDKSGKEWQSTMNGHYGYFKRSSGKDGDQVDVVVKPETETSPKVFVVDQVDPGTGKFDEHKVIMGTESAEEAKDLYLSNYEKGWKGFGAITEMDQSEFKAWLKDGKRTKKPVGQLRDKGSVDTTKALKEAFTETIVAAALKLEDGRIIEGVVHADAHNKLEDWEVGSIVDDTGFVTNFGRYLTREEASELVGIKFDPESHTAGDSADIVGKDIIEEPLKQKITETFGDGFFDLALESLSGVKNAIKGLGALFTPKNTLSSGFIFNEETYAAAKPPQTTKEKSKSEFKKATQIGKIIDFFTRELRSGKGYKNILQARKAISEETGMEIVGGTLNSKIVDEAIEVAGVNAARAIIDGGREHNATSADIFDRLVELQGRMPNLSVRTSTSVRDQAYSTPLPLAWLASELAGINKDTTVYESSAGNGALVIGANPENVTVNELNPERYENLLGMGFSVVSNSDGTVYVSIPKDVVVSNPPFGAVKDDNGVSKTWKINDQYTTTQIDHAMVFKALESMKPGGRAVFIVGSVNDRNIDPNARKLMYRAKNKVSFYKTLFDNYNVVDHFSIAGKLYSQQGAAWPVDVIVIDGKGKSKRALPGAVAPDYLSTIEELKGKLNEKVHSVDNARNGKSGTKSSSDQILPETGGSNPNGDITPVSPVGQNTGTDQRGPGPETGSKAPGGKTLGSGDTGRDDVSVSGDSSVRTPVGKRPVSGLPGVSGNNSTDETNNKNKPDSGSDTGRREGNGVDSVSGQSDNSLESELANTSEADLRDKVNSFLQRAAEYGTMAQARDITQGDNDRLLHDIDKGYIKKENAIRLYETAVKEGVATKRKYDNFISLLSPQKPAQSLKQNQKTFEPGNPVTWTDKKGNKLSGTLSKKVNTNWFVDKGDGKSTLVPEKMLSLKDNFKGEDSPLKKPEVLKTYTNKEDGVQSIITKGIEDGKFHVVLKDIDSGNILTTGYIFPKMADAVKKAKEILGPKESSDNSIGKNQDGKKIFQDKNGVRSIEEAPGIMSNQPVTIVPGGTNTFQSPSSLYNSGRYEYLTAEEIKGFEGKTLPKGWTGTKPAGYGTKNKVFTKDAADKARELLKKKLSGTQLYSGLDPEIMQAGIQLAGYHIEAGTRGFAAYSKAMINDIGDAIKPYLRAFYEGVRYYPGVDTKGMSDAKDIDKVIADDYNEGTNKEVSNDRSDTGRTQNNEAGADTDRKPEPLSDTDTHVAYHPSSDSGAIGTLTPLNLADASEKALAAIVKKHGKIDDFVADRLGYTLEDIKGKDGEFGYFSGEQVDAIALAIDNIDKGAGFIIGDQTGVGKGRVVAAMLRFAIKNDLTPIFVTDKPNLYADMYRDFSDIGMADIWDKILVTNANLKIPMEGKNSKIIKTKANHNQELTKIVNSGVGLPSQYQVIFTTYDQMSQTGSPRRAFIEAMAANNGMLIMDESHKAGGSGMKETATKLPREIWIRRVIDSAHSVFYSSATYAKRPDVMDLYRRTDMRLAVDNIDDLGTVINSGGVPLQQAVAAMLVRAGQYIRRERSFFGVSYGVKGIPVDHRVATDMSVTFKKIFDFSEAFIKAAIDDIGDTGAAGGVGVHGGTAAAQAKISAKGFSSVMHNIIGQSLLALKVDAAVDEAIQSHKEGRKPIIALANTMGSFVKEYAEENGLKPGDGIGLKFNDLLFRYLDKTRSYTIKQPYTDGPGTPHYISDAELGPAGVAAFNEVKQFIFDLDLENVPVSPIDHALMRLREAGIRVAEITGRNHTIEYRPDGSQRYRMRSGKERSIAAKLATIEDFNKDNLDSLIVNQSASTGLSLHAIPKWEGHDPAQREMILLQAEANIDTHMQMLGRVHRAGQVKPPIYTQLMGDLPTEKRPAAVLLGKMASLNANTTAAKDSDMTAKDVMDFMNKYGDKVVAGLMADFPEIHSALGDPLGHSDSSESGMEEEGAAKKITGRVAMLPTIKQQEEIYSMIESGYKDLIQQLDATGQNDLEAKTFDTDAKTLEKATVFEGSDQGSPFTESAFAEIVDMKKLGKSFSSDEVQIALKEAIFGFNTRTARDTEKTLEEISSESASTYYEKRADLLDSFNVYEHGMLDDIEKEERRRAVASRLTAVKSDWTRIFDRVIPGTVLEIPINGIYFDTVVLSVEQNGNPNNPLALGTWKATVAVPDSIKRIVVPFSFINRMESFRNKGSITPSKLARFDRASQVARETRTIMTGNLLAAYSRYPRGRIINYSNDKGVVNQGVLMPVDFDLNAAAAERPVLINKVEDAVTLLHAGIFIKATKGDLSITPKPTQFTISVPAARASGSKYFLNTGLIDAVGGDFVKAGNRMKKTIPMSDVTKVLRYLIEGMGEPFSNAADSNRVRQLLGIELPSFEPVANRNNAETPMPESEGNRPVNQSGKQNYRVTDRGKRLVQGAKSIKIEGYENIDFFVYKNEDDKWSIIEERTGLKAGEGDTQKAAKDKVKNDLARIYPTEKDFIEALDKMPQAADMPDQDVKFQTSDDIAPGQGVSLKNIQAKFPGQAVFLSPDGSISIRFKNGKGTRILSTQQLPDGTVQFAMESGRMTPNGRILGATINHTIYLNDDLASDLIVWHEQKHLFDNLGMIHPKENLLLMSEFNKLKRADKLIHEPSTIKDQKLARDEDLANTFAQVMKEREQYRKTPLGAMIQRIMDFLDGILHLGRQSVRKLAREAESGEIFKRGGSSKEQSALFQTSEDIIKQKFNSDTTLRESAEEFVNKAKSKEERSLAADRVTAKLFDNLHFIKTRLDDRSYKLHRQLTGVKTATFAMFLEHGPLSWIGDALTVTTKNKGVLPFLKSIGPDWQNLLYWVAAKRAEQLEKEGRENWLDKNARDKIFAKVGTHSKNGQTWAALNLRFQTINKNVLDIAEQAGLIDPEARELWESNFYIPFYRIFEDETTKQEFLSGPHRSKQHISAQIKKLKGGNAKIGDPLENVLTNWMHLIDAAARNKARAAAFEVGQQVGIIEEVEKKDLVKILGSETIKRYAVIKEGATKARNIFDTREEAEAWAYDLTDQGKGEYKVEPRTTYKVVFGSMKDYGILSFQRNGEAVYFKTDDTDLFEALSEIDTKAFNNVFMRMMGGAKRMLSYGATFGPPFRIRNMIRDTVHTAVVSKSFMPFIDTASGFIKAMQEDQDYIEYMASGFGFGSSYINSDDPKQGARFLKNIIRTEGKGALKRIIDPLRPWDNIFLRGWEKIGSASENAARLGLYTNLKKNGMSNFDAGFEGRDLMDFSMRGSSQTVQILTRIVPFLNARFQALYKLGRASKENPKAFLLKSAMLTTAALALWALFKDDERYNSLPDWDKWTYFHFWVGKDHYRMPKPFEIGALFCSLPESIANVQNGTEEGKFVWDWFKFTSISVFNVDIPQLFKPAIEEQFNIDTFRGRQIVPEHMTKLKPSEQYHPWTSDTMRMLGGAMNYSPIKLQHYVNGYLSTIGMMGLTLTDVITRQAMGYPSRPAGDKNPFMLNIKDSGDPRSTKYVDRFYKLYEEVETANRTLNHYVMTDQGEKAQEFFQDNIEKISLKKPANKIRAALGEINDRLKQVQRDKRLSPEDKREKIDQLNKVKNDIVKTLFEKIRQGK